MRRTSVMVAVTGFFAMAIVGWLSGVPALTCGIRAVIGAMVLYVATTIASRIVVKIMADVIIRGSVEAKGLRNNAAENRK